MGESGGGVVHQHQPSVFELVSQQGFANSLKPAFLHVVKTLAEWHPEGHTSFVFRNFDEIFLAWDSLVQSYYFRTRGATLTESFYGLERNVVEPHNSIRRLRLSYILSVILPYFQAKLEKARDDYEVSNRETSFEKLPKICTDAYKLLIQWYPLIKSAIYFANLVYLVKYAFGFVKSHDILWNLLGITLGYPNPQKAKLLEEKKAELYKLETWRNLKRVPFLLVRILGESVLFGVEAGSFVVQFLDWWYNDPQKPKVSLGALPIPPPPSARDQNVVTFSDAEKNKCPLCRKPFRNPTAVSVSGIVFCYGCILPHLQKEGRCPLTSLPIRLDNLVRLYM